jgi:hypothetical protein
LIFIQLFTIRQYWFPTQQLLFENFAVFVLLPEQLLPTLSCQPTPRILARSEVGRCVPEGGLSPPGELAEASAASGPVEALAEVPAVAVWLAVAFLPDPKPLAVVPPDPLDCAVPAPVLDALALLVDPALALALAEWPLPVPEPLPPVLFEALAVPGPLVEALDWLLLVLDDELKAEAASVKLITVSKAADVTSDNLVVEMRFIFSLPFVPSGMHRPMKYRGSLARLSAAVDAVAGGLPAEGG